jgi:hypothetical protein
MKCLSFVRLGELAMCGFLIPAYAQPAWIRHGTLIAPGDLPAVFAASLKAMGGEFNRLVWYGSRPSHRPGTRLSSFPGKRWYSGCHL